MRSIPMQKKVARLDHEIERAKASADEATVRGEPWSSDVRAKLVPLVMSDQALKRAFEEAEAAMSSEESAAAYFQAELRIVIFAEWDAFYNKTRRPHVADPQLRALFAPGCEYYTDCAIDEQVRRLPTLLAQLAKGTHPMIPPEMIGQARRAIGAHVTEMMARSEALTASTHAFEKADTDRVDNASAVRLELRRLKFSWLSERSRVEVRRVIPVVRRSRKKVVAVAAQPTVGAQPTGAAPLLLAPVAPGTAPPTEVA